MAVQPTGITPPKKRETFGCLLVVCLAAPQPQPELRQLDLLGPLVVLHGTGLALRAIAFDELEAQVDTGRLQSSRRECLAWDETAGCPKRMTNGQSRYPSGRSPVIFLIKC